jgi:hypothetical protein
VKLGVLLGVGPDGLRQGVAQGVADWIAISAKCWSEWQDLNLRPPRPERG